ncbi:MAG: hypothetical protein OQK04_03600, partial [Kangiellaceae bacterium]|nr:hypothetical protein [Kangiellaceae bacterium]
MNKNMIGIQRKAKLNDLIFLVLWPWFFIFLVSTILYLLDVLTFSIFLQAALKIWGIFVVSFILFNLIERLLHKPLKGAIGLHGWLLKPLITVILFICVAPIVDVEFEPNLPNVKIVPLVIIFLVSLIFVASMYILKQRENFYHSQLHAQQVELQVLKMQSNPH